MININTLFKTQKFMPHIKHKLNELGVILIDKHNPITSLGISRISSKTI